MLRIYQVGAFMLQYEEGHQPAGAVEVKAAARRDKAAAPRTMVAPASDRALADMTVRELVEICARERIETPRKPNKAQLVAAIEAARAE